MEAARRHTALTRNAPPARVGLVSCIAPPVSGSTNNSGTAVRNACQESLVRSSARVFFPRSPPRTRPHHHAHRPDVVVARRHLRPATPPSHRACSTARESESAPVCTTSASSPLATSPRWSPPSGAVRFSPPNAWSPHVPCWCRSASSNAITCCRCIWSRKAAGCSSASATRLITLPSLPSNTCLAARPRLASLPSRNFFQLLDSRKRDTTGEVAVPPSSEHYGDSSSMILSYAQQTAAKAIRLRSVEGNIWVRFDWPRVLISIWSLRSPSSEILFSKVCRSVSR